MAADKEVLEHLFVNVLELDEADINALRKKGWWRYSKIARYDKESGERVQDKITTVFWQEVQYFRMYVDEYAPSEIGFSSVRCFGPGTLFDNASTQVY